MCSPWQLRKRAGMFWGHDSGSGWGPASLYRTLGSPPQFHPHHHLDLVLERRVWSLDPVHISGTFDSEMNGHKCWKDNHCFLSPFWNVQKEMHRTCTVSSDELEKRYQESLRMKNPSCYQNNVVEFRAGKHFYQLNFKGDSCFTAQYFKSNRFSVVFGHIKVAVMLSCDERSDKIIQ